MPQKLQQLFEGSLHHDVAVPDAPRSLKRAAPNGVAELATETHAVNGRRQLASFLQCDRLGASHLVTPSHSSRTSFDERFEYKPEHTLGDDCDFETMKLCKNEKNNKMEPCKNLTQEQLHEKKTLGDIYPGIDGQKDGKGWLRYFWPGRAGKGDCNNIRDRERGCWYKARLTAPAKCTAKEHCLAVVAHDGEWEHRLTCPSWIRNEKGNRCNVPQGWQACPERFTLKRFAPPPPGNAGLLGAAGNMVKSLGSWIGGGNKAVEETKTEPEPLPPTGTPEQFFTAIMTPCEYADDKTQVCTDGFIPGNPADDEAVKHTGMYYDLGTNEWYRCTPWLRCEKYPIVEIFDATKTGGQCGAEHCRQDEDCFVHETPGTHEITKQCVPNWNTFVFSDSSGILED